MAKETLSMLEGRKVTRVYRGQNGKCCCGCSGTYFDGDKSIHRGITQLLRERERWDVGPNYIAAESPSGTRLLIAYFD